MVVLGQKISNRYRIIKNIGEGGMANVYLAYDEILKRNVAVKVLRGDLADDEKFVRRFQREALSASSLNHINIVEMYDVGEEDGNYFIVMEYIEGKTLKNLVKRRKHLVLSEMTDIMLQLTSGLAHAHDAYIIHRDIKPQNILVLENGLIKLTDFGIATALNDSAFTQTNSVMGSVHYLPPEQANGKGSTIKSDIYSLGILMYELVTGKIPFKGENAVEIAIKQMKEPIPHICSDANDIPQSVENIILKATAKNPKNRYNNVHEMAEDLKVCLTNEHANDKKYTFKYHEVDVQETKITSKIKLDNSSGDVKKPDKAMNIIIGFLAFVLFMMAAGVFAFLIIFPAKTDVPNIAIPDVSGMTIIAAENKLHEVGLKTAIDILLVSDDNIEKELIVKTSPMIGRTVKKDSEITLYKSSGSSIVILEDYIGQNYNEAKVKIEEIHHLYVILEKKDVKDADAYDMDEIIDQKPGEGTNLKKGDIVTLYIPNIVNEYPDMIAELYTESDIDAFASKYKIILSKEYVETTDYQEGVVFHQSRSEGTTIIEGTSFKVKIASAPLGEE